MGLRMPKIQDVRHRSSRPAVAHDRPKGVRPALQRGDQATRNCRPRTNPQRPSGVACIERLGQNMKVNGIKSAEHWQREYRRTRIDTYPSVKFIQSVQADALRVAGNTVARPGTTKRQAAIDILEAASALEQSA